MQRKVQIVSNRSENSTKFRLRQLWCLFQAFLRGGIHSAAPNPPLQCFLVPAAVSEGAGVAPRSAKTWGMDGVVDGVRLVTQGQPVSEKLPDRSELLWDTLRPSTNIIFEREGLWQALVYSTRSVAGGQKKALVWRNETPNLQQSRKQPPVLEGTCRLLKIDFLLGINPGWNCEGMTFTPGEALIPLPSAFLPLPRSTSFPLLLPLLFSMFVFLSSKRIWSLAWLRFKWLIIAYLHEIWLEYGPELSVKEGKCGWYFILYCGWYFNQTLMLKTWSFQRWEGEAGGVGCCLCLVP